MAPRHVGCLRWPGESFALAATTALAISKSGLDIASALSAKLDTSVPHSARVWNYWLGGKDNFDADRHLLEGHFELLWSTPRI